MWDMVRHWAVTLGHAPLSNKWFDLDYPRTHSYAIGKVKRIKGRKASGHCVIRFRGSPFLRDDTDQGAKTY